MRWYKRDTAEYEKPHVLELYRKHGFKGQFFWTRLNDLLAEKFNFWCPGCYKFQTMIFYAYFYPQIKDPRLIRKMMLFLNDEKIITSSSGGRTLYIYYSGIIDKADEYTKKCQKRAEDRKQEQPESANSLTFECNEMQKRQTLSKWPNANDHIENKRVKH